MKPTPILRSSIAGLLITAALGAAALPSEASYIFRQTAPGLTAAPVAPATPPDTIWQYGGYRAYLDGTYAASCKGYLTGSSTYPYQGATGDGVYRINVGGNATDVFCDMTTGGGGWTMWYSTANFYHLAVSPTNSVAFGTDGYSRDLRALPFQEVLYVQHSTGNKDWFSRDTGGSIRVIDHIANGVVSVGGSTFGQWTGHGGASTGVSYQMVVGDGTWMQVGLMISSYTSCWKLTNNWCGDMSATYYRINGEGNGVPNQGAMNGVAFRQNGHQNLSGQLLSVGVR